MHIDRNSFAEFARAESVEDKGEEEDFGRGTFDLC